MTPSWGTLRIFLSSQARERDFSGGVAQDECLGTRGDFHFCCWTGSTQLGMHSTNKQPGHHRRAVGRRYLWKDLKQLKDSQQFLKSLSELCRNDWSHPIFSKVWAGLNINEVQNSVFKYTEIYHLLGKGTVLSALLKKWSSVWMWAHVLLKHSETYLFKMCVASSVDLLLNYSSISIICTAFTNSHAGHRHDYKRGITSVWNKRRIWSTAAWAG